MPMPQVPQPIQQAVPPTPLPSVIEDIEDIRIPFMPNEKPITFTPPQLPPVFEQPIIAPPVAIPPSLPDPVPLERIPIQIPRDEQIFVPPRNIVDIDIPREFILPERRPFLSMLSTKLMFENLPSLSFPHFICPFFAALIL